MVPNHGFGDVNRIPIQEVSPDFLVELMEESGSEQPAVEVNLTGSSAKGFRVRYEDTTIGYLEREQAAAYTELDWIIDAGLRPLVTARVTMVEFDGEEWPSFDVELPAPGLCVPVNNPPAERWAMLPGTTSATITQFQSKMDVFPESAEHFLVTLHARRFFGRRSVNVAVDGVQIASLSRDDAHRLADTVSSYQNSGLLAVARAYYCIDEGKPRLVVYADERSDDKHAVVAGVAGAATAASMGLSAVAAARAEAQEHTNVNFFGSTNNEVAALMSSQTSSMPLVGGSAGLKLVAAASAAIIVGGGANLAASIFSVDEQAREEATEAQSRSYEGSVFPRGLSPYRDIFGTSSAQKATEEPSSRTTSREDSRSRAEDRDGLDSSSRDADSRERTIDRSAVATRKQTSDAVEPTAEPNTDEGSRDSDERILAAPDAQTTLEGTKENPRDPSRPTSPRHASGDAQNLPAPLPVPTLPPATPTKEPSPQPRNATEPTRTAPSPTRTDTTIPKPPATSTTPTTSELSSTSTTPTPTKEASTTETKETSTTEKSTTPDSTTRPASPTPTVWKPITPGTIIIRG